VNLLGLVSRDGNIDSVSLLPRLACAATAATAAGVLTHPIDVVRGNVPSDFGARGAMEAGRQAVQAVVAAPPRTKLLSAIASSTATRTMALELCAIDVVKNAGVNAGFQSSPGLLLCAGGVAGMLAPIMLQAASQMRPALAFTARQPVHMLSLGSIALAAPKQESNPLSFAGKTSGLRLACARGGPAAAANALVRVGLVTHFLQAQAAA
jgi:hypothetical protein